MSWSIGVIEAYEARREKVENDCKILSSLWSHTPFLLAAAGLTPAMESAEGRLPVFAGRQKKVWCPAT
jgi:hypothetical protein